jgi:signal transduction histidine kinase
MPTGERARRTEPPPTATGSRPVAAQEARRGRTARKSNDDIRLRLALLSLETSRPAPGGDDSARRQGRDLERDVAHDTERRSARSRTPRQEPVGLVTAIDTLCRELLAHWNLRVEFTHEQLPRAVPGEVVLCLYRIAQEALHNVIKHSGVRGARVHLTSHARELLLRIGDAGTGFAATDPAAIGSGLSSMQQYVTSIGGRLIVHATPGHGTRIVATIDFTESGQEGSST